MLHIDVNIQRDKEYVDGLAVVVEVSADGGPWKGLVALPIYKHSNDLNETQRKIEGRKFAMAWMDGARYAGAEVRATSFGEEGL
jgi:hypothetical protein